MTNCGPATKIVFALRTISGDCDFRVAMESASGGQGDGLKAGSIKPTYRGLHRTKPASSGPDKDRAMGDNVIELTDATLDEVIYNSNEPVIVDFWASWCGACKVIAPIIREIANKYAGKVKVCKLDTQQSRDSALEFGISGIPTTILFKNGRVQKRWVGLISKKELAAAIDKLLKDTQ